MVRVLDELDGAENAEGRRQLQGWGGTEMLETAVTRTVRTSTARKSERVRMTQQAVAVRPRATARPFTVPLFTTLLFLSDPLRVWAPACANQMVSCQIVATSKRQ